MKIELWYDAVAKETDVLINGVPISKNDVYGFLYPVRNYPIQSWLYPTGSWKGIVYQITDLARDEEVEFIFHGRKIDYYDVEKCVSECNQIKLTFVEWDVCNRYNHLFTNLFSTLKENDVIMKKWLLSYNSDFNYDSHFDFSDTESIWAYHIYNGSDFDKADDVEDKCCCYIHDSYLSSYDKLETLLTLTRSLKIPSDAIYCCFNDEKKMKDFQYYARSFKRMNFNFCLENTDYHQEALEKYGLPHIVKLKIEKCVDYSQLLSRNYLEMKETTQSDFNKMKKNIVNLTTDETIIFQNIKQLRNHADQFRHGMNLINGYIDILLSVSKDNKEEILHYECIDKLEENIQLYLNANSLSGVR